MKLIANQKNVIINKNLKYRAKLFISFTFPSSKYPILIASYLTLVWISKWGSK